jgi:hypothetical protein
MIVLTAIAMAAAAQEGGKGPVPTVTATHFLVSDGAATPVESRRVPYRPGSSCYQWVIEVPREDRELAVREVFQLPGGARIWGGVDFDVDAAAPQDDAMTVVNGDRSTGVTEFTDSLDDGVISHGWCVAPGDPTGAHRIRVFIGDRLLQEFRFEIVAESY